MTDGQIVGVTFLAMFLLFGLSFLCLTAKWSGTFTAVMTVIAGVALLGEIMFAVGLVLEWWGVS